MRSTVGMLLAATLLAATAAVAKANEPEWIRQFGTGSQDNASAVATGPDGRVHVVGWTDGRFYGRGNKGIYNDAIIITFDRDGTELWRRQPGTTTNDIAHGVATDADGNVYVVGDTMGALGGAFKGDYYDAFVIKYDRDGKVFWRRQPGTTASDYGFGVATDADGNVYVVGWTYCDLCGTGKGDFDAFVIKYDSDGRTVWKRQPGTTSSERAEGVATDVDGNVYVVGWTDGALGGANKGSRDAFVIKYDRDGRIVWKRQPGTAEDDSAVGVATDADGNVYMVGQTYGALGGANKGGYSDAFVIKFDRDGRTVWKRQPGTTEYDTAHGVATGGDGSVYVVGYTQGELGGANKGDNDVFVFKFDRDGRVLWSDQPGTTDIDWFPAVATDADGNAYMAGITSGSLPGNTNLGVGPFSYDAFLIKYGPNGPR